MHPLRVCMLSVHTCPLATLGGKETGGMNVYVRDLSRELGRRGHKVDVFTRLQDPDRPRVNDQLGFGGRVIHIQAGPPQPIHKYAIYDHLDEFAAGVRDFAACEGTSYDVIHSHYWLSGEVAIHLREAWGIPFIHMFHTLAYMKNSVAQRPEELEPALRLDVERRVMAAADAIVAATPLEKAQMSWLYGADASKIHVIPCGVDLAHFYPIPQNQAKAYLGLPTGRRMILYVGRIEPLKGVDTLLRAVALLVQKEPALAQELMVTIIGGNPELPPVEMDAEMARLHALRAELHIEDVVTFRAATMQDILPLYYSAAEVVVVPSHYESFGMVALEAMACGIPVIATKVGGLAYTVQDGVTGFHIPSRDHTALAEKLELLLKDEDLRRDMGRAARQAAARYGWSDLAGEVVALYEKVLAGTSRQTMDFASHRAACGT